jgi:thiamine pyrophosphate-dependent acetolactate synthase large subunit-like protein
MTGGEGMLERRSVLKPVLSARGDGLVVPSLGTANYDLFVVDDRPENVYIWNAMGITASIGLGLALAQPERRVLVTAGDGDMLMGIGSLATIAVQAPDNLAILVVDNGLFEETGSQSGLTASGVDIAGMAKAAGFRETMTATEESDVEKLAEFLWERRGPVLAVAKVGPATHKPVFPSMDGPAIVRRFREAVAGAAV